MLISCGKQDNVVFLNYETGVEEYEFSSEEVLILPNVSKDNFVFIGWTDGENYYAGLTEVDVSGLTLTPDFVAIEEVFTSVYIKNNGVYLGNYIGDSTIVGIPYYWNDYLIVNADSFRNRTDIEKIF